MKKYTLFSTFSILVILVASVVVLKNTDFSFIATKAQTFYATLIGSNTTLSSYRISPSRNIPGVFRFTYEFLTQSTGDDSAFFDIAIAQFDEDRAKKEIGDPDVDFGNLRDAWGYPVQENFFHGGGAIFNTGTRTESKLQSVNPFAVKQALASDNDPNVVGLVNCRANTGVTGYFKAYFEDVALNNNVNYDDPTLGQARRDEVCQVLQDISILIGLNNTNVTPDILFKKDPGNIPSNALAAASTYYGIQPNFSKLWTDNGLVHKHIITRQDPTPNAGSFDAYVITNFASTVSWDVDSTLNANTFDFYTVMYHEILHTLSFRSLLPANVSPTNVARLHNTYDEGLYKDSTLINKFYDSVTKLVRVQQGNPSPWFITNTGVYRGVKNIPNATPDGIRSVYTPTLWQQGSSISHFDMTRANTTYVMHPVMVKNVTRSIHDHEKEVLCHIGYQVIGMNGCELATPVAVKDNVVTRGPVCVNFLSNDQSFSGGSLSIDTLTLKTVYPGDSFVYYGSAGCTGSVVANPNSAKSFRFIPSTDDSPRFLEYTNKDSVSNRISFPADINIIVCDPALDEYVCNGDFEMPILPADHHLYLNCESVWNPSQHVPFWCNWVGTPDLQQYTTTEFIWLPPTPAFECVGCNGGQRFVEFFKESFPPMNNIPGKNYKEGLLGELKEPLTPGQEYELTLDIFARVHQIYTINPISGAFIEAGLSTQPNIVGPFYTSTPPLDQMILNETIPFNLSPNTFTKITKRFVANGPHAFLGLTGDFVSGDGLRITYNVDNVSIKPVAPTPVVDLCSNIAGVQNAVPSGHVQMPNGICKPLIITSPPLRIPDLCPNILGIQKTIPNGYILDSNGECNKILIGTPRFIVPKFKDQCPNISGFQLFIPAGYQINSFGECEPISAPSCVLPTVTINPSVDKRVRPAESGIHIADLTVSNTSTCSYDIINVKMSYSNLKDPAGNLQAPSLTAFMQYFIQPSIYTYDQNGTVIGQGTFIDGVSNGIPLSGNIIPSTTANLRIYGEMPNVPGYGGFSFTPIGAYEITFKDASNQISNVLVTGVNINSNPVLTVVD
jgi:hypothetical protein